ncbi:RluA family pseudouridine synthase [Candidatus Poseidonia alphae]|nr:RluA family pseudouridine synthase [Candidatus Poseidonia alphae]
MEIDVNEDTALLDVLKNQYPQSSSAKLRKMLTQGRVTVNGEVEHRAKETVVKGTMVLVLDRPAAFDKTPPPTVKNPVDLDVIFEDEDLLVVNKPAHLLSVATDRLEVDTLHSRGVDYLRFSNPKAWCFIVHRLDKETSGVMVLAKNKSAKEYLQEQFGERQVHRLYLALVEGVVETKQGTVSTWLMEDKFLNVKAVNSKHPKGKEAISHYQILKENEDNSLVEVEIETGRRHQIRMAMQYLSTPVVGDELHGAETDPYHRVCLHAHSLEFLHPSTDDPVRFEATPPRLFNIR